MVGTAFLWMRSSGDEVQIATSVGTFRFYHSQDCCENVGVESINGYTDEAIGETIVVAEERVVQQKDLEYGSQTSTFYTIRTNSMDLDMRWVGASNGYYSESVDIEFTPDPELLILAREAQRNRGQRRRLR
jgi:hypothetical protein